MRDAQIAQLVGRQFNRISRRQLIDLGMSDTAIAHGVASGRLVRVEEGVFAVAPVLHHDEWGRWMGATLTAPGSVLGSVRVFRSTTIEEDRTHLRGIPISSVPRTLLDIARVVRNRARARAVREAVRLGLVDLITLGDSLGRYRGRRGSRALAGTVARYAGLPIERARSGAEVRALEILRAADLPPPRLNVRVAGEEADLSWPGFRMIIEIDARTCSTLSVPEYPREHILRDARPPGMRPAVGTPGRSMSRRRV